jgi:hypothetical protein
VWLLFRFACAVERITVIYEIDILPHESVITAAVNELIMRASMLSSVVLVCPAASSISALALTLQQLNLCQALNDTTQFNVLGWSIGSDDRAVMRGAVIGNVLIIFAQFVLLCAIAGVAYTVNDTKSFVREVSRVFTLLQWPTVMHITVGAVLQLTVAASVSLFRMTNAYFDMIIATLGFLLCVGYPLMIAVRVRQIYLDVFGNLMFLSTREILLLPRPQDQFLFGEFSKPWYAIFESIFLLLIGIASGTPPAQPYNCDLQLYFVAVLTLISLALLLLFLPMRTAQALAGAIAVRVLTLVFIGSTFVATTSVSNQFTAQNGAIVSLLLLAIIGFCKGLWDIASVMRGGILLFRYLFPPRRVAEPDALFETIPDPPIEMDEEPQPASSSSSSEEGYLPQATLLRETDAVDFLGGSTEPEIGNDLAMILPRARHAAGEDDFTNIMSLLK